MAGKKKRTKASSPAKRAEFRDAYELLTDAHMEEALKRRRDVINARLADLALNEMLTDGIAKEWQPGEHEQHKSQKKLYKDVLDDIARRLAGAERLRRPWLMNGAHETAESDG
jgi:hypothetical protein